MSKSNMTINPLPARAQMYRVPRALHARAEAEAKRQRQHTGAPVTWQQILRATLDAHLPK
jgi:hypothetical protein